MADCILVKVVLLSALVFSISARRSNPVKSNSATLDSSQQTDQVLDLDDVAILDELAREAAETRAHDDMNDVSVEAEVLSTLRTLQEDMETVRSQLSSLKLQTQLVYKTVRRSQRCKTERSNRPNDQEAEDSSKQISSPRQKCPRQFFYSADYNMCYRFGSERITWRMAQERCLIQGADLVTVTSSKQQNYLNQQASTSPDTRHCDFWIGLSDQNHHGNWKWVANGNSISYSNWNLNEPNNSGGNEHCVHSMWVFNWAWNDATCNYGNSCYICELPAN